MPGNGVYGVFRNDFAVRMLRASVPAGIEAPLRIYVTENADGTSRLTYRKPSAVLKPYGSADLDGMAAELDEIFAIIIADAVANRYIPRKARRIRKIVPAMAAEAGTVMTQAAAMVVRWPRLTSLRRRACSSGSALVVLRASP